MAKCKVTIEGVGKGILFNNPAGMGKVESSTKKKIYIAEEDAAKSRYLAENGNLAFPSWNILQGLVRAASGAKLPSNKKKPLAPIIAGDVELSPDMVEFGNNEYNIDSRRAVVQRQGIIRHRAWLPKWTLTFEVKWETQYLGEDFGSTVLRELLETLGGSIGIGDFRPEKRGPFGKFKVVAIEAIKE